MMTLARAALRGLLLLGVSPGPAAAQTTVANRTMQQVIDRVLKDYSPVTRPTVAVAQARGANPTPGAVHHEPVCAGAEPLPDAVRVQLYVARLSGIDQKAGTYAVEGYLRLFWTDPRLAFMNESSAGELMHRASMLAAACCTPIVVIIDDSIASLPMQAAVVSTSWSFGSGRGWPPHRYGFPITSL